MSRRKLSAKDWAALNAGVVIASRRFPPEGRPEQNLPNTRAQRRRKKRGKRSSSRTRARKRWYVSLTPDSSREGRSDPAA